MSNLLATAVSMQEIFMDEIKKSEEHLKVKAKDFWTEAVMEGDHLFFSAHMNHGSGYYALGFKYSRYMENFSAYSHAYKIKNELPRKLAQSLVYTIYSKELK